jgi:energy-coupling factor transporter ATP-binding protein EcfA2
MQIGGFNHFHKWFTTHLKKSTASKRQKMEANIEFQRSPKQTFVFQRINILLGANGTGKSKTLEELKTNATKFYPGRPLIYVEGGRTIRLRNELTDRSLSNEFNTLERTETAHKNKLHNSLSARVMDALMLLEQKGQEIRGSHSDQVELWIRSGKEGNIPARPEPPLDKLFSLFTEIFPAITLAFDPRNKTLTCSKNGGSPYPLNKLSDGEKQVLSILADIALLAASDSLILVDEPELNLNPSLASRLWETIENDLTNCIFIYATHDVGFSMRSNVERVFVLSNQNENISEIKNIREINPDDLRSLLGSIPAILSTNSALITEGKVNSFDSIFYRWLLGISTVEIVPMGGGADVLAVSNRQGVWEAIAPSVSIKGIIDRDYKSEDTLSKLATANTIVLDFHEAESYLCIPKIVKTVADTIGLTEKLPTIEQIKKIIREDFEEDILQIAAQRVFDKTATRLAVAIQKKDLQRMQSEKELEEKLIEEAKRQTEFAGKHLSEEKVKGFLAQEMLACKKAIEDNNINEMLRLTQGKRLISKLFTLTGARSISDYARACAKHIKVDEIPGLKKLRDAINSKPAPKATLIDAPVEEEL